MMCLRIREPCLPIENPVHHLCFASAAFQRRSHA